MKDFQSFTHKICAYGTNLDIRIISQNEQKKMHRHEEQYETNNLSHP